jgi:hypothetical protein
VGLTQRKLMFALARPARTPRPKREAFIMRVHLGRVLETSVVERVCKPTDVAG